MRTANIKGCRLRSFLFAVRRISGSADKSVLPLILLTTGRTRIIIAIV